MPKVLSEKEVVARMAWIREHGGEPEQLIRLARAKEAGKLTDVEYQTEWERIWEEQLLKAE
jgi:hypothetical protein